MIQITPAAIEQIKKQIGDRYLRLGVKGSGCSGYTHVIQFDEMPKDKDTQLDIEGIRVIIDPKSILFLNGSTLEWKYSLIEQGFIFINPNVLSQCGCGKSFSV
jgi:iron-sulfur cluster assembly protein